MREYTVTESQTGGWVVTDPSSSAILGSYTTTAEMLDGLLDIIASKTVASGEIIMQEGDV